MSHGGSKRPRYGWRFLGFALVVAAITAGVTWGLWCYFPTWGQRASFGAMLGAAAALFSGLAFAALIVTLQMQRAELELQRKDLRLQRQEMALTREELA